MKSHQILLFIFSLFFTINKVQAQSNYNPNSAPSDAVTGYTYDFDIAKKLIIEFQVQPNETNSIAKPIVKQKTFPKIGNNKPQDISYNEKLKEWMEKNPNIIIETLKPRKDIVFPFTK
ncbi:MAG: hypothetical protein JNM96_02755 [Bacteroidia bacterium]|nr:hypothetical protein [Bacteroidia bacterium]